MVFFHLNIEVKVLECELNIVEEWGFPKFTNSLQRLPRFDKIW
jgi:hypothetical protein